MSTSLKYDLDKLGWAEFEGLCQTLLKARLGMGVESWGGSGDWGCDSYFDGTLTYPSTEKELGPFVFQAKFVIAANAAGAKSDHLLLKAIDNECKRIIQRLAPQKFKMEKWKKAPAHYGLLTNAPISPGLRIAIKDKIKAVLPHSNIHCHSGQDVCAWLASNPEIVPAFPQLLTVTDWEGLINHAVNAGVYNRSQTALSLAKQVAKVFVPTKSYYEAQEKLKKHHFVILEGPPEVGKTTIGRMIAIAQTVLNWEAIECKNPKELLNVIAPARSQVFLADDFFGRGEYEPSRMSQWEEELPYILSQMNGTHWLILTSRAHIYNIAKKQLDVSGENHRFPKIGEVLVDAGKMSNLEKGKILYRHIKNANLEFSYSKFICNNVDSIVKNHHFTPLRIKNLIVAIRDLTPQSSDKKISIQIQDSISKYLDNPTHEMRVTFRKLSCAHKWLLFTILESGDRPSLFSQASDMTRLEDRYNSLCPEDGHELFSRVLGELSEGFIQVIIHNNVHVGLTWIHPSCQDLAIEELASSLKNRQRFLDLCIEDGIEKAISVAGGGDGSRYLPLLVQESDWMHLQRRCCDLLSEPIKITNILLKTYSSLNLLNLKIPKETVDRFHLLITCLWDTYLLKVKNVFLTQPRHLAQFYQMRGIADATNVVPHIQSIWITTVRDIIESMKSSNVIEEELIYLNNFTKIANILRDFEPYFWNKTTTKILLSRAFSAIVERIDKEIDTYPDYYGSDVDSIDQASSDNMELSKIFNELTDLSLGCHSYYLSFNDAHFYFTRQSRRLDSIADERTPPDFGDEDRLEASEEIEERPLTLRRLFDDV